MQSHRELDTLIAVVNVELETGNWTGVVGLTQSLYAWAVEAGDLVLAELVQDLHWIANDALVRPLEVMALVQP